MDVNPTVQYLYLIRSTPVHSLQVVHERTNMVVVPGSRIFIPGFHNWNLQVVVRQEGVQHQVVDLPILPGIIATSGVYGYRSGI
jgi:hypothetical protein